MEQFGNNYMKIKEEKCHFIVFYGGANEQLSMNIGSCAVNNSEEQKLLRVLIDTNLSFEKYMSNICLKAGSKLFALSNISAYCHELIN